MADFHFQVGHIKRSAGQSAVASAAYRACEKLHSDYYDEFNDYSRKGGHIHSEILLPDFVPEEYKDREFLWNDVERTEKRKDAQLAYSFDFALMNEFTIEENIDIARRFIQENFVDKGMICDWAFHLPDKEEGIPNPHIHLMCPIRPMKEDGTWGPKQKNVYHLDENGEVMRDENGRKIYDSVKTTDWSDPETLEYITYQMKTAHSRPQTWYSKNACGLAVLHLITIYSRFRQKGKIWKIIIIRKVTSNISLAIQNSW